MLFLKFMPWRSGFQGEFPVCRVPLNEEWCPLKCIIPPPAVQGLMRCWGPPAWELGCSTPSTPTSCSWESCFGANGFQSLGHHTAMLFPVPSLWSPSLSWQTLREPAQGKRHKPCSALVRPWPPSPPLDGKWGSDWCSPCLPPAHPALQTTRHSPVPAWFASFAAEMYNCIFLS